VLTHVTHTLQAIGRGAPVDLVFQSIGGTEATNTSLLALLQEAREAALLLHRAKLLDKSGQRSANVMYFETGQGSALSANAHHDCDQQTIEARAYAVARHFKPLLVNTVVGFIGPEYLFNLDSSVGRARVGCWRRVRVGATTLQAHAREAEQRPRARCQWLNRVRSAVTQKVNSVEAEIVNVHQELSKKSSGQLRNPG